MNSKPDMDDAVKIIDFVILLYIATCLAILLLKPTQLKVAKIEIHSPKHPEDIHSLDSRASGYVKGYWELQIGHGLSLINLSLFFFGHTGYCDGDHVAP